MSKLYDYLESSFLQEAIHRGAMCFKYSEQEGLMARRHPMYGDFVKIDGVTFGQVKALVDGANKIIESPDFNKLSERCFVIEYTPKKDGEYYVVQIGIVINVWEAEASRYASGDDAQIALAEKYYKGLRELDWYTVTAE